MVSLESGCLVARGSPLKALAEIDRADVRSEAVVQRAAERAGLHGITQD